MKLLQQILECGGRFVKETYVELNFEVMARQKGIIKLKGTIGDITFYKTQDGHLAREKGGIDASRIASDPAFQRTRENGAEFGRAGKAGKILRTSLRALLLNSADGRMVSRLTQRMVKVIQADLVSERGLRNVIDGEAELTCVLSLTFVENLVPVCLLHLWCN